MPGSMDEFQQHFGGKSSSVLNPQPDRPVSRITDAAQDATQTGTMIGKALMNDPSATPTNTATGGPRYDRFRARPYTGK